MKKKWCRKLGMMCKDKNCEYEHLDEPPEICDAILKFDNGYYFCMCELDKGHEKEHTALNFKWNNMEEIWSDDKRLQGIALMMWEIDYRNNYT